ncbi:MAG: leucine-rich repeat domain-containing protein, partial [Alkalilacustris sp.]
MSDPDTAYAAARQEIAHARAKGAKELSFDHEPFRALDRLPPDIADLDGLKSLDLSNTRIHDLLPLAGLTGLQGLYLNHTAVQDLLPLAGL